MRVVARHVPAARTTLPATRCESSKRLAMPAMSNASIAPAKRMWSPSATAPRRRRRVPATTAATSNAATRRTRHPQHSRSHRDPDASVRPATSAARPRATVTFQRSPSLRADSSTEPRWSARFQPNEPVSASSEPRTAPSTRVSCTSFATLLAQSRCARCRMRRPSPSLPRASRQRAIRDNATTSNSPTARCRAHRGDPIPRRLPIRSPCSSGSSVARSGMFRRALPVTRSACQSSASVAWFGPDRTSTPLADHLSSRRPTCPFASNGASFSRPTSDSTVRSRSLPAHCHLHVTRQRAGQRRCEQRRIEVVDVGREIQPTIPAFARPVRAQRHRRDRSKATAATRRAHRTIPPHRAQPAPVGRSGALIAVVARTSNCSSVPARCAFNPATRTRSEFHSAIAAFHVESRLHFAQHPNRAARVDAGASTCSVTPSERKRIAQLERSAQRRLGQSPVQFAAHGDVRVAVSREIAVDRIRRRVQFDARSAHMTVPSYDRRARNGRRVFRRHVADLRSHQCSANGHPARTAAAEARPTAATVSSRHCEITCSDAAASRSITSARSQHRRDPRRRRSPAFAFPRSCRPLESAVCRRACRAAAFRRAPTVRSRRRTPPRPVRRPSAIHWLLAITPDVATIDATMSAATSASTHHSRVIGPAQP